MSHPLVVFTEPRTDLSNGQSSCYHPLSETQTMNDGSLSLLQRHREIIFENIFKTLAKLERFEMVENQLSLGSRILQCLLKVVLHFILVATLFLFKLHL